MVQHPFGGTPCLHMQARARSESLGWENSVCRSYTETAWEIPFSGSYHITCWVSAGKVLLWVLVFSTHSGWTAPLRRHNSPLKWNMSLLTQRKLLVTYRLGWNKYCQPKTFQELKFKKLKHLNPKNFPFHSQHAPWVLPPLHTSLVYTRLNSDWFIQYCFYIVLAHGFWTEVNQCAFKHNVKCG